MRAAGDEKQHRYCEALQHIGDDMNDARLDSRRLALIEAVDND